MPRGRSGGRRSHGHRSHGHRSHGHRIGHRHHHHHHRSGGGGSYRYRGGTPRVAIPKTSENWVIFPYDKKNRKWITSDYLPSQTKDRASVDEIEKFLNEVNEPLAAWYKEYGAVYEGGGAYLCLFIILIPLLPIWIFYVCWITAAQPKAEKKLEEVKVKIKAIIKEKGSHFAERGLIWNLNIHFPRWIELWAGESLSGVNQVLFDLGSTTNIEMMSMMFQQNQGGMMMGQGGLNMMSYQQSGYPQMQQNPLQQGNEIGGGQGFHQGNVIVPVQQGSQLQQGFTMYNANTYGGG